jgi:peptide chain release factor subunit 1
MLSATTFSKLLELHAPVPGVVSLYLPADQRLTRVHTFSSLLRTRPVEDPGFSEVSEDLKRLDEFVDLGFEPEGWRGLAVFSCKRLDLWQACPLPETVNPVLRMSDRPYLAPLLSIVDQHQRFGVVLAGERLTRFLTVFMGQVKEHEELALDLRAMGPAQGCSVSQRLAALSSEQEFSRIVLGGPSEVMGRLAGHLRTELPQPLILDESLGPDTLASVVLELITSYENEARQARENVLTHRLLDLAASGGPAVLGLEQALQALRRNQVRLLLARDGYAKMGRRCPRCGDLSLAYPRCPACNCPTEAVFNVVEEMIARALDSHCEVMRLLHPSPLDNMGHIGAELSEEAAPRTPS